MRKLVLSLAGAASLWLGLSNAAQAQYGLIVNAPSDVAGSVLPIGKPATTAPFFGIGDPALYREIHTGFCQYVAPDTLVLGAPAPGSLTGKIAVVHRGTVSFGHKIFLCEQAGAVGVIVVNAPGRALGGMAPGDSGALATIPSVMVTQAWESSVRADIVAGTLNVSIGDPRGQFPINLTADMAQLICPTQVHIPRHMVKDTGDLHFQVGGNITNNGNQPQTNVTLKAMIRRVAPLPRVLYMDSATYPAINPFEDTTGVTDKVGSLLSEFDLVGADPNGSGGNGQTWGGHYQLIYTVSGAPGEYNISDNTLVRDFYVSQNTYTRTELDTTATATHGTPLYTGGLTVLNGGEIYWGQEHHMGSRAGMLQSITFAMAVITTNSDSLGGESASLEVSRWDDINGDITITDNELTLVGNGSHVFDNNADSYKFFTETIYDATGSGAAGVKLYQGNRYIFIIHYGGTETIFIAQDQGVNYEIWRQQNNTVDIAFPLNTGVDWSLPFSYDNAPAMRMDIDSTETIIGTQPLSLPTAMSVFPNPAQDRIQVSVGDPVGAGSAIIRIRDLAGRVVSERTEALQGTSSYFKFSVSTIPGGLYNVEVTTGHGVVSKKLVITR